MSLFSETGGISPDSANYLRVAIEKSPYINDVFAGDGKTFFSVWPLGYPALITALSYILPLDVLAISKIVNISMLAIACVFIVHSFPQYGYLYAMLFLTDSFVRISYMTWSDVPFSSTLIIFAISCYRFYKSPSIYWLISIGITTIAAFLFRYIGIFLLLPIGGIGLWYLHQKNYKYFGWMCGVGTIVLLIMSYYLWNNYQITGSITGIDRPKSPETNLELLKRLVIYHFKGTQLTVIPLIIYALYYRMKKNKEQKKTNKFHDNAWIFFLGTGITYWICLVTMRWNFYFDQFNNRLLAPAFILFSMALLNYMLQKKHMVKDIKKAITIMVCCVLLYHLPVKMALGKAPFFLPTWHEKQSQYNTIKNNSIVLFSDLDIVYYNHKIQPPFPFPYSSPISYTDLILRDLDSDTKLKQYIYELCTRTKATYIYIDPTKAKKQYNIAQEETNNEIKELSLLKGTKTDITLLHKCSPLND